MSCALCGEICRCSSDPNTATPRWLSDTLEAAPVVSAPVEPELLDSVPDIPATESAVSPAAEEAPVEDSQLWRNEVAARLNRYQARRKPRPPRYPSLQLRVEQPEASATVSHDDESGSFSQPAWVSNYALALDSFIETAGPSDAFSHDSALAQESQDTAAFRSVDPAIESRTAPPTGKLIEFPRSWTPTPPPLDQLAEPVVDRDRPRILEAPEFVPPPPALGGITIEPVQQPEMEKRPGIDIPLQSAPVGRRIFAAALDGLVIAAASAVFGFIFWKLTAIRPPRLQMAGLAAGLSATFWAAYQYLLLVYSGSTPGLRLARLELARFDGSPAGRRLRRWRVLASFLSAASLGMGYAWVFLDEDSLCWHDRITHTYLAPMK